MARINLVMALFMAGLVALSVKQLMAHSVSLTADILGVVMAFCWLAAVVVLVRAELRERAPEASDDHPEVKR